MRERARAGRRRLGAAIALFAVLAWSPSLRAAQDPVISSAASAAEAWLARIDARDIEGAWAQLAPEARACSTGGENAQLQAILSSFGPLRHRALKKSKQHKRLDGLPPLSGKKYVELRYKTVFESADADESIVMVPTGQGWEVQRYCINGDIRK